MGQRVTLTHSAEAPRPPWALLVWQIVSFSDLPSEFSLAYPLSWTWSCSITEILPAMLKVLFFWRLENDAWASLSQAQQLDWQIWENWVSGIEVKRDDCNAWASWLNPWLIAAPSPGNWVKLQGHSGSVISGKVTIGSWQITAPAPPAPYSATAAPPSI